MKPEARALSGWRGLALAALLLAAFTLALYARLLFTNRVLATGDVLLYFYPYRDYAAQALREGRLPFWNPYLFMGAPFLANPQSAVLYPLHWPFGWLSVTSQVAWSAALHTWLLGMGGVLLARRLGARWLGSFVAGIVLAGSGFYGGMIGHLNQMNGAAWLPWTVLLVTPPPQGWRRGRLALDAALLGLIVALTLLSGHTQTAYINLFGAGLWVVWLGFAPLWQGRSVRLRALEWRPLAALVAGCAVGVLLAGPQLLPAFELSEQGLRSGGLGYLDATAFSLKPLRLPWTLLPTYGLANLEMIFDTPAWTEFVAWLGLIGLALAVAGAWKGRGRLRACGLLFLAAGLFLALGRWNPVYALLHAAIPGFDLFRTPARWLMLYTLGGAILAGTGGDFLAAAWSASGRRVWIVQTIIPLALAVDLLLASLGLPHTHPTAPQAVESLRTAPAHLLTDPSRALNPAAASRFLGMSTITYDPGDAPDYRRILVDEAAHPLSEQAFADLVVALKVQELLVPNLPLLWRVPAVDGYDGGVLPLKRYNLLASLLLPPDRTATDGRLREQMRDFPAASLLGMLGAGSIVTDKVRDLWYEDLFYDRQIGARLTASQPTVAIDVPQPFEATHVDLIAAVDGATDTLAGGVRDVARVRVIGERAEEFPLTAGDAPGAQVADGALNSPMAARSGATVAFRDVEGGRQEYRVRLPLAAPQTPERIEVRLTDPMLELVVQAATLYDARTGMFAPLLPSDRGAFRLTHSGDVKVYEVEEPRQRAYLVPRTTVVATPEEALARLKAGIDTAQIAVVEAGPAISGTLAAGDGVTITAYAPEQVELKTTSAGNALLVLSDAWYPGWQATVDGAPQPIAPTNLLFRGVEVPPGEHTVIFTYQPTAFARGLWLALGGALFWLALAAIAAIRAQRAGGAGV